METQQLFISNNKKPYNNLLICLFLITAILISYWPLMYNDFVEFDDQEYITENSNVQKDFSIKSIKWAFTTFHAANWHPVTWLSHMADYRLYGLNAKGHHITSLLLHILNTLLLFQILAKLTNSICKSALVAALFALHPLHVESVAWIAERKDVLSTFFGMLSIAAYIRYVNNLRMPYYFLTFLLLCIGLMAKPMLVTLPFILLLMDFWPLRRFIKTPFPYAKKQSFNKLVYEKIPLFIPVIISCVLTFIAQHKAGAVKSLDIYPFYIRLANALFAYVKYIYKAIWPDNLAFFYPHAYNYIAMWEIIGVIIVISLAVLISIHAADKHPYFLFGLFFYLITLIPVIGIIQVGSQSMADRYTYIPLTGIFIIIAWAASDFFAKFKYQNIVFTIFSCILIISCIGATNIQVRHWQNSLSLFKHALNVTSNNWKAHHGYGLALYNKNKVEEAIFHYKETIKINPYYARVYNSLGSAVFKKGNIEESIFHYKKALSLNPNSASIYNNLGTVLIKKGNINKAYNCFLKALEINPEKEQIHHNLANAFYVHRKYKKAIFHYKQAIKINPQYTTAHYNLGILFAKQKNIKKAAHHFLKTIKLKPDYYNAYNELGIIYAKQKKYETAKTFFLKAIQLEPDDNVSANNLKILKQYIISEK